MPNQPIPVSFTFPNQETFTVFRIFIKAYNESRLSEQDMQALVNHIDQFEDGIKKLIFKLVSQQSGGPSLKF